MVTTYPLRLTSLAYGIIAFYSSYSGLSFVAESCLEMVSLGNDSGFGCKVIAAVAPIILASFSADDAILIYFLQYR